MGEINFSTGVVERKVNGIRSIYYNPSDIGFADRLFSLASKVEEIDKKLREKLDKADAAKSFDYYRVAEKQKREAVDEVFGAGFCEDVFKGTSVTASLAGDGGTPLENFIFAVLDDMDADVRDKLDRRSDKINKYTEKYRNRA